MCSFYPRIKPQVLVNVVKRRVVVKKYCISCIPQSAGFLGSVALSLHSRVIFRIILALPLQHTVIKFNQDNRAYKNKASKLRGGFCPMQRFRGLCASSCAISCWKWML